MRELDLVVRNARVATAADIFDCDIGAAGGFVAALASDLPPGPGERSMRPDAGCFPAASTAMREATHRAIAFGELVDLPVLIVHVSGREAVEQIRWAQGSGLHVYAETCPQYLFLSSDNLDADGFAGAKCICSPPPRGKANQQVIWDGLVNGVFQVFSSDHAPFRFDGPHGKKVGGEHAAFSQIPNGIPGLETRLALLFSEGVMKGRIDINAFVALTSTNVAKTYGLYPRKGTIAIGSDADLVIWDDARELAITKAMLHHDVDYTPSEGMKLNAWPALTISRGEVVWDGSRPQGTPGRGRFLRCDRPHPAMRRRAIAVEPSSTRKRYLAAKGAP